MNLPRIKGELTLAEFSRDGYLADIYRAGYLQAIDDVVGEAAEAIADITRGICTLDEAAGRLETCDFWPDIPDEYDDDPRPEAPCADCGKGTLRSLNGDWYMVHDEVWAAACMPSRVDLGSTENGGHRGAYLCRHCLEKRLGRRLTRNDYTSAPVNSRILHELKEVPA
jgi:hypothetical protein